MGDKMAAEGKSSEPRRSGGKARAGSLAAAPVAQHATRRLRLRGVQGAAAAVGGAHGSTSSIACALGRGESGAALFGVAGPTWPAAAAHASNDDTSALYTARARPSPPTDAMAFALGAPALPATPAALARRAATRCTASVAAPTPAALSARAGLSSRAGLHAPQRTRRASAARAAHADQTEDGMYVDLCPGFAFFKARSARAHVG